MRVLTSIGPSNCPGFDWFKVSIVKPGVPLDIVLNRESKRKTDSLVTVREGIRYFGTDAAGLSTRFPETTYPFIKNLLGLSYNDPIAAEYRALYSNGMIPEEARNTVAFDVSGTVYTVEELLAMQFAHAKRQAEISGGEGVSGAVVTVPPYLSHFERQAIVDAAEIAGVRLLQLMNDGTAIALNYAMTRTITDPQYHIFFDMGAGSTVATLVKFTSVKIKKVQVPHIEILATGYDKKLGGKAIDVKLQKFLAKQFMTSTTGSKAKEPILNNARSMAKLLKEANRVKQILSANTETIASVEGLHEEIDFKVKVTRAELEGLIGADYFKKLLEPIKKVLKEGDVTLTKLDSLILVGGAVRIPAVQTALKELVGEDKIAQNVNQDEANVLGAGFRAAGISKQFKVREIKIKDVAQTPIEIIYNLEPHGSETSGKATQTSLFAKNSTLPSKKLMNFKRTTDFSFQLAYNNAGKQTPIVSARVSGLADAIAKHKETAVELPKVQAQIELTDSLLLNVDHALATFELKPVKKEAGSGSIAENVMNFFGGKKDKKDDKKGAEGDKKEDSPEGDAEKKEETKDEKKDEKKEDAKKSDKKVDKKDDKMKNVTEPASNKITTEKVKLTVELKYETLSPLTQEVKEAARKRFAAMDEEDAARRAREEAMNNLEAYIYSSQEFLESNTILLVSTEEQREALSVQVGTAAVWLDDVGFEAPTAELKEKLAEVKTLRGPIYSRVQELEKRPVAIAAFRENLAKASAFIEGIRGNNTVEGHMFFGLYEESDFEAGFDLIKEAEAWLVKKEEAQAKLATHETPAFKANDVDTRAEELINVIVRKFNRMPKKPVKPKVTKSSASTTTTAAQANATETPVASQQESTEKPVGDEEKAEKSEEATDKTGDESGHSEL
ncbi:UNVERIFIED_CONTAM: Hypoxia up-regulated protein 1 [Siphonaria sp. JEL0065]|nr:Hypoxia up-regulated protein 1 [Siphonaria sp. JEL0065]